MELSHLRKILQAPIVKLYDSYTHDRLPALCETLGLPPPAPEGYKRERLSDSFANLPDTQLPQVAERYLRHFNDSAELRNELQEFLWADEPIPKIPKKFRREIARKLSLFQGDLYGNSTAFMELLANLWVIDELAFVIFDIPGLRAEIEQHVLRNPKDWSVDDLFDKLGAYSCTDKRFALFLEGLASEAVRPDVEAQYAFVGCVNGTLNQCGVELRETETDGGYPVFKIVSLTKIVSGRPKNLIFASSEKPDLRFRDAVNNDIEIVTNADKVLVYDRQIPSEGLLWKDLQAWWADHKQLSTEEDAKRSLYNRLLKSLPENSPPQRLFFKEYFNRFKKAIPMLPALLPEVWLHWDPQTVKERGPDALLRYRMDFLMLLPNSIRVVIEIDGQHHYADNTGKASPSKYGAMTASDRELRLAGYDVYRFGAVELSESEGPTVVGKFFDDLFKLYRVQVPH